MLQAIDKLDPRTPAQIRDAYEIERELAARLRSASREDRRSLYSSLYDEMYRRTPLHPQLIRKASAEETRIQVGRQMAFLQRFLNPQTIFLEVGPGDCALSFEVAKQAERVIAVDVSDEITRSESAPARFTRILSDGCSIPVPEASIDVAYSNQLMEHLHPEDAALQLGNLLAALKPGGKYVCVTPNRFSGPHDVSKYFDLEATGFHLKEYTVTELNELFRRVGFRHVQAYAGARRFIIRVPVVLIRVWEMVLDALPLGLSRRIGRSLLSRVTLGIRIVGIK